MDIKSMTIGVDLSDLTEDELAEHTYHLMHLRHLIGEELLHVMDELRHRGLIPPDPHNN